MSKHAKSPPGVKAPSLPVKGEHGQKPSTPAYAVRQKKQLASPEAYSKTLPGVWK